MGDVLSKKEQADLEHVVNWLMDLPQRNPRRGARRLADDRREAAAGLRRAAGYLDCDKGGPDGRASKPVDEPRARLWTYAALLRLAGRR